MLTIKLLQSFLQYLVVVALEIKFKFFLDKDKEKTIAHINSLLLKATSLFFYFNEPVTALKVIHYSTLIINHYTQSFIYNKFENSYFVVDLTERSTM